MNGMGVREGSKMGPVPPGQESFFEKLCKTEVHGENACFARIQEEILYHPYLSQNSSHDGVTLFFPAYI